MTENRTQDWVKFIAPFLIGLCGTMVGGAINWGITQQKLSDFERRLSVQEGATQAISTQATNDRVYIAGQFGEIKAKIDQLQRN